MGPIHFLESKKLAYENELDHTARSATKSLIEEINCLPFTALERAVLDTANVPLNIISGTSPEKDDVIQTSTRLFLNRVNHMNIPLKNHYKGFGEYDERTMDLFVTPSVTKFVDPDGTTVLEFTLKYDYDTNFKGLKATHGGITRLTRTSASAL